MNEEIRADKGRFDRAFLIGVQMHPTPRAEIEEHLDELESLVATLGVPVAGRQVVRIAKPSPQFLVGKGKMEEIKGWLEELECDLLVFDDDLAPPQQHLWEAKAKVAVIDRRKVIIDIFGQRAQTREARLQVELARLEYTLPRLKRAWTHLERQRGGGAFVGGAGEAQIEVDRRIVRDRIAKLKRELDEVREHRGTQRKKRELKPVPTAALVGYTNSGKSSLLNAMTNAGVLQEDKLFATLDPTTRRVVLPNNQEMLLSDTVGFIRKLPHTLVEAFQSTLEEAARADFLVHVVDAFHPQALDHVRVTKQVLKDLAADGVPTILLLNKMDLFETEEERAEAAARFAGEAEIVLPASVKEGWGLDAVASTLASFLAGSLMDLRLRVPASRFDVVAAAHRLGEVLEEKHDGDSIRLRVLYPARHAPAVQEWVVEPWPEEAEAEAAER